MAATDYAVYLLAVAAAVVVYGLRPVTRWRYRKFQGPKVEWLFGNKAAALSMEQHGRFKEWTDSYGPGVVAVTIGASTVLVPADQDDARKILAVNKARPDEIREEKVYASAPDNDPIDMLLWASGDRWKSLKTLWTPLFHKPRLEGYMKTMDTAARLLVEEIGWHADKKEFFEVQSMIQAMTMNVIGQSAFGIELHTQAADKAEQSQEERMRSQRLLQAAKAYLEPAGIGLYLIISKLCPFLTPILAKLATIFPDKEAARYKQARVDFRNVVQELLDGHKASTLQNGSNSGSNSDSSVGEASKQKVSSGSFLDMLVRQSSKESGEEFSPNQQAQQVMLMVIAGYETSANALIFSLYLLSKNPEKQAKLCKELNSRAKGFTPTYGDLESGLPYLEAVVKEALRLYPPAYLLAREAGDDQDIGGSSVRKGSWFAVSVYSLHRSEKIWGSDASQFRPERWLTQDPDTQRLNNKGFLAFGSGIRTCPGEKFGMLEIKTALIKIFQNFNIFLAPNQEPLALRSSLTLGTRNGLYVRAERRH